MYRIESTVIEELRERDLNINHLLKTYIKKQKKKTVIEYQINNKLIVHAKEQYGIDIEAEMIAAIQKDIEMHGEEFEVVIRRK